MTNEPTVTQSDKTVADLMYLATKDMYKRRIIAARHRIAAEAPLKARIAELEVIASDALDALLHLEEGALGYASGPMDADGMGYLYPVKDELVSRLMSILKPEGGHHEG